MKLKYKDRVIITGGFYEGFYGVIISNGIFVGAMVKVYKDADLLCYETTDYISKRHLNLLK